MMDLKHTEPVVVVAALAQSQGRLFLARRAAGLIDGGSWELPGGKVEPGEDHFSALLRELREELDIGAVAAGEVLKYRIVRECHEYLFVVFPVEFIGIPATGSAHDCQAWVEMEDIQRYRLAFLDAEPVEAWAAKKISFR